MGLLDALSAGIGAAAPAGAALAQGQAQATQSNTGFLEKLAAMQQAKQKADMDRQMAQSQIEHLGAQTKSLLNPPVKPKEAYTVPGVGLVERDENGNYAVKVAARDKPESSITPYQSAMLGLARDRLAQGANKPTREENATQLASRARTVAGISDMNTADAGMGSYEAKLANGTASIDGLDQITGRMANSFTHDDPLSQTLQSATLSILDRSNPELARYLRQGLTFAEGESMISQRPSDFRTKMATFLSTAASGASKDQIADIQHRRKNMLNRLNPLFPESGAAAGTPPLTMGTATPQGQSSAAPAPSAPPAPAPSADPFTPLVPSKGKRP